MGSNNGNTTTRTEPPRFVQPFIEDVLRQGQNQFYNFSPEYFPGSTVAPISPYTSQAVDQLAGFGNSSFNTGAIANAQQAQQTLAGAQANPALQAGLNQTQNSLPFFNLLRGQAAQGVGVAPGNAGQQAANISPPTTPNAPSSGVSGSVSPVGTISNLQDLYRTVNISTPTTAPTAIETTAGQVSPTDTLNRVMGQVPGVNPYVDALVDRVLQANARNFEINQLAPIQNQSELSGGYGGSRQGVAEGLAREGLARANADVAAQIYADQFNQDSARQLQAAGQAGALQQAGSNTGLSRTAQDRAFGLQSEGLRQTVAGQDFDRQLSAAGLGGNLGLAGDQLALAQQSADRNFGLGQGNLALQGLGLDRNYQNALVQQALQGSGMGTSLLQSGQSNALQGAQGALALSPTLQQMGLLGTQQLLGAGDIDNTYRQALLQDEVNRFNFAQQQPYQSLSQYTNSVYGLPGLGGQNVNTPVQSGGFAGALGGAATAAGLLGGLSQAGITMSNPMSGALIALGALGGFF